MILGFLVGSLGAIAGLMKGGRLAGIAFTHLKALWLLPIALVLQILATRPEGNISVVAGLLAANAVLVLLLFLNRHFAGTRIAAIGLLLNSLVIGLNGGMPVSQKAASVAALTPTEVQASAPEHVPETASTRLLWLGDTIPLPNSNLVVSIGDILLALGIARFLYRRALADINTPSIRESLGVAREVRT